MAKKKKTQEDWNINIGGGVHIERGDFIGRDKNVSVESGGIHVEGNVVINQQAALQEELFESLLKQIDQRLNIPPDTANNLKTNVQEFKAEADKGAQADEKYLARRIRNIEHLSPEIRDVLLETLTNPAAGLATIVKRVAERAKAQSGSARE